MLSKQAKSHIRRFRAWNILHLFIIVLLAVTISVLMMTDIFTVTQGLLACAVITAAYYFGSRFVNALMWKRHVYNLLLDELNAPLFVEVLEGVCKYDPFSLFQLQKLQAEGRYADVVSLCTIQLVRWGIGQDANKILIGNIMLLIPGIALTNSLRDLIGGDIITGLLRFLDAILVAAAIAAGYILAASVLGGVL